MTARRRRKSGSGPSASALIAWVGGSGAGSAAHAGALLSVIGDASAGVDAPAGGVAGGRAILLGRACGLTAGTLLAFGSVVVGATNVGEPLAGTPMFNSLPAAPEAAADTSAESHPDVPAAPVSAAPDQVSAQAVTETTQPLHPPLGQVHRNAPVSVGVPATEPSAPSGAVKQPSRPQPPAKSQTPQGPVAPITPVLAPAAQGVGRVAPVGGVLAPKNPNQKHVNSEAGPSRDAPAASSRDRRPILPLAGTVGTVKRVAAPLDKVTNKITDQTTGAVTQPLTQSVVRPAERAVAAPVARPATSMLDSLLPIR